MKVAYVCALGLWQLGCDAGREARLARDIAHLCRAEEQLREAPNAAKSQLLSALVRAPCPEPAACAARDKCGAAYTVHVDALALTQAAKQSMAFGEHEKAAKLLGSAESMLKQAQGPVDECTALIAALRREHGVTK